MNMRLPRQKNFFIIKEKSFNFVKYYTTIIISKQKYLKSISLNYKAFLMLTLKKCFKKKN
jgi:hypothetical protein